MMEQESKNIDGENKIFISWSGESSKKIAVQIKKCLEETIFSQTDLKCFVSSLDISSGEDWWNEIKKELNDCKLEILCITKENVKAPWIFFEAGAMTTRAVPTIPILFSCKIKELIGLPIKANQGIEFEEKDQFLKMIYDINETMKLLPVSTSQLEVIANEAYNKLKKNINKTLKKLNKTQQITERHIYPEKVKTMERNTLYISAPMSSVDDEFYKELRKNILSLKPHLINMGFTKIVCPLFEKESSNTFDGKIKAIKDNFVNLKQVDCMIIIYPKNIPSSLLVEIGYGLALCKKTVIFYGDKLPYILEEAGGTIDHIKTYKYSEFEDITNYLERNGMDIFDGGKDE